jgi:hypothetical protein
MRHRRSSLISVVRPVASRAAVSLSLVLAPTLAFGTGLATCDSGPQEGWQPQATLEKQLTEKGWKVNRIKIDGGCYEVYAIDEQGKRVEAYFHPETLAPVPTKAQ